MFLRLQGLENQALTARSVVLQLATLQLAAHERTDMAKMAKKSKSVAGWKHPSRRDFARGVYKAAGPEPLCAAKELKLTRPRLNDIVLERRAITADTAVRLARYFGTTAQFWMNMQSSYDLREAENENHRIVESIAPRRDAA